MQSRYTPQHPDIVRLKKMIEDLEQQIESGSIELPQALKHNFSMDQLDQFSPMLVERRRSLQRQATAIKLEIKTLNTESANILDSIAKYQKLVDETPLREQELQLLKRDYNNVRKSYNSLLDRKSQAQLAVNLERKRKGEQFHVLRQALLPREPTEPNLKKIYFFTLFLALHIGLGLIFLLEYFDTKVRQVRDLESNLGIPVLATIPKIYTARDKARYGINKVLTYISMVVAAALCATFTLMVLNGVESTLEMINELVARS
jgi:uncharacterized protein involved in exopolysaccharide biosynthesis